MKVGFDEVAHVEKLIVAEDSAAKTRSLELIAGDYRAMKKLAAFLREVKNCTNADELHDLEKLYGTEAELALSRWQESASVQGSSEHVDYELALYCAESAESRLKELLSLQLPANPESEEASEAKDTEAPAMIRNGLTIKTELPLGTVMYLVFAAFVSTVHPLGAAWVPLLIAAWLESEKKSDLAQAATLLACLVGAFAFFHH